MTDYVVYEPSTQEVFLRGSGNIGKVDPSVFSLTARVLECDLTDFSGGLYVSNGEVHEKSEFALSVSADQILADGSDIARISNVPSGTTVVWRDGYEGVVDDGVVEMATDFPADYRFIFRHPRHIAAEVVIEAISPA